MVKNNILKLLNNLIFKVIFYCYSLNRCQISFWVVAYIRRQRHLLAFYGDNNFLDSILFKVFVIRTPFGEVEISPTFVDMIFYRPRNRSNVGILRIFCFVGVAIVAGVF